MGYNDFKHFDEHDALFRNSKGKVKPCLLYTSDAADEL